MVKLLRIPHLEYVYKICSINIYGFNFCIYRKLIKIQLNQKFCMRNY